LERELEQYTGSGLSKFLCKKLFRSISGYYFYPYEVSSISLYHLFLAHAYQNNFCDFAENAILQWFILCAPRGVSNRSVVERNWADDNSKQYYFTSPVVLPVLSLRVPLHP